MPEMSGIELLGAVRAEKIPCGVIVLTGHGDPQLALECMKAGADDFVAKPCDPSRLALLVRRTLEQRQLLIDELEHLRNQLRVDYRFHSILSKSPKMRRIFDLIKHVGPLGSTVLIWGETGTGKELIAQAIHASDTRREGPFVALNCAALERLAARKRAVRPRARGLHRRRPPQEGPVRDGRRRDLVPRRDRRNLGRRCRPSCSGSSSRAPSSGLEGPRRSRSTSGSSPPRTSGWKTRSRPARFRSDLFYRLAVVRIDVPPLRERAEDIPLLALHFLEKLTAKSTPPVTEIDSGRCRRCSNTPGRATSGSSRTRSRRPSRWPTAPSSTGTRYPPRSPPEEGRMPAARALGSGNLIDIERHPARADRQLVAQVEREYFTRLLDPVQGERRPMRPA